MEADPDSRFLSKRKVGKDDMRAFTWQGKQAGYGVAWYCKACSRVVIAQVLGRPDEKHLEDRAVQVLATLDDHPKGDWTTWALYDLHTEVPNDFEQAGVSLRAGLTELTFKRDTEKIVVARWGMAQVALGGKSLDVWARKQFVKPWQSFHPHSDKAIFRSHDALTVSGQSSQPFGLAIRLGRHVARKVYPDQLIAHLWHCEPTNRIYVVYGIVDVVNRGLLTEIRDRDGVSLEVAATRAVRRTGRGASPPAPLPAGEGGDPGRPGAFPKVRCRRGVPRERGGSAIGRIGTTTPHRRDAGATEAGDCSRFPTLHFPREATKPCTAAQAYSSSLPWVWWESPQFEPTAHKRRRCWRRRPRCATRGSWTKPSHCSSRRCRRTRGSSRRG